MKKTLAVLLTLVLIMSIGVTSVFAGNGDGSGGGDGEPLALEDALISEDSIVLTFSKNVVNMKVKDNNMNCFELKDENGSDVIFEVEMGDDQVDPDCKRIITIKPTDGIDTTKTYTLTIKADLTSKSGVALGEDKIVEFPAEGISDDTSDCTEPITPDTDTTTQEEPKESNAFLYIVIAAVIVVVIVAAVVIKKRK